MKKILSVASLLFLLHFASLAQVGINILIPDSSAVLQLESSTKGLGLPRLNSPERDSIHNPLRGLTIFNTQDSLIEYWNGECWLKAYEKNCYECQFNMSISNSSDTIDRTVIKHGNYGSTHQWHAIYFNHLSFITSTGGKCLF
jgi:hypothetical protein